MIPRKSLLSLIQRNIKGYPVTLILGPRQCGKTTLARQVSAGSRATYFDLEDPETPLRPEVAKLTLRDLRGLIVIDEFQRQPSLFPLLRTLADRRPLPARFLILGSASLELVRGVSESLAGRVAYVTMGGFSLDEVKEGSLERLWIRGGFPRSFLARTEGESFSWRKNFMQSILERDIPQLGIRIPASTLRKFWTMVAHFHGQIWNAADFARSLGSKEDTARHYLEVLSSAYMLRQLRPWFENLGKRLVKAPKIYIRDSGLLHALLGLRSRSEVQSHIKLGFSWEGFALDQILRMTGAEEEAYFYRTHAGAELDLLLVRGGKRYGIEFKYEDAPRFTKSMRVVIDGLNLRELLVVHPGETGYRLREDVEVVPLARIAQALARHKLLSQK